jgi:hypothetical protein
MPSEQTTHIPPEEEGGLNFLKSLDRFALVEGIFHNARRRVGDRRRGVLACDFSSNKHACTDTATTPGRNLKLI